MTAPAAETLECVALLERDRNEDLLTTWVYPAAEEGLRTALEQWVTILAAGALAAHHQQRTDDDAAEAAATDDQPPHPFIFTKYKTSWVYIQGADGKEAGGGGTMVWVAVVVSSTGFNPERYEALLRAMLNAATSTASGSGATTTTTTMTTPSPPKLLECFLSVQIKGRYAPGGFVAADHDPRKALLVSDIKHLVPALGVEFIVVWTALLMKKRVAVYGAAVTDVLAAVRGLPALVWHRQDWSGRLLRPWVTLDPDSQLAELEQAGVFVAGFTDPGVRALPDLYDVLVDLDQRTVRVMDHAAPDFKMGAFHKDLATYLLQAAADPDVSAQAIIKEVAVRTKELLTKLAALRVEHEDGNKYITLEGLQARKLPPNMDRFLYNVAGAENMTFNTHK